MTAQHVAYLILAAFAAYCAAWAINDWSGRTVTAHVEAALAPDFFAEIDDLRADFCDDFDQWEAEVTP